MYVIMIISRIREFLRRNESHEVVFLCDVGRNETHADVGRGSHHLWHSRRRVSVAGATVHTCRSERPRLSRIASNSRPIHGLGRSPVPACGAGHSLYCGAPAGAPVGDSRHCDQAVSELCFGITQQKEGAAGREFRLRAFCFARWYNAPVTEIYTIEAFKESARLFAQQLQPRKAATVVALHGDLGAGKTTFVQTVAAALGVHSEVVSPTFVIQKRYSLEGQSFSQLIHIDAYRLESAEELSVLGWSDIARDPANLILIEWPEHVADLLTEDAIHVHFSYIDEETRGIVYGS